MNNAMFVHKRQSLTDLLYNFRSLFLRGFLSFFNLGKVSVRQVFKNQVNVVFIMEVSVHSSQVLMIKVKLNF